MLFRAVTIYCLLVGVDFLHEGEEEERREDWFTPSSTLVKSPVDSTDSIDHRITRDGSQNLVAGMSSGAFWSIVLTISLCTSVALLAGLFLRRRQARSSSKQHSPELQLNSGDGQYVVAYTLKPPKQSQPDILNPPPDGSPPNLKCGVEAVKNGTLHTSDEWSERVARAPERRVSISEKTSTPSTNTASSKPITISTTTLSRRGHLLAEEIPGPESCV